MELIIQFVINLCDLAIFWYYLNTFRKKKNNISKKLSVSLIVILALIWAGINTLGYPSANLLTLVVNLCILSILFEGSKWSKIISIIIFMGVGILAELIGLILLHTINYDLNTGEKSIYYFTALLVTFIRGNIIYFACKLCSSKKVNLEKFPKEIVAGLILIFGFSVINCCFIINLTVESRSQRSLFMCISLIVSIVLTYCFMIYMMDRFNILLRKRHEDELYRNEMYYKEVYYSELEKRNEYVQNLKHDLKNKLYGLVYFVKKRDMDQLSEQISVIYEELGKIDATSYCANPVVDSVLRIKMGVAKAAGIETNVNIRIPNKIELDYGDIGVLYGNLLDNAIEACMKLPEEDRFIRVENKIVEGNMLLIIQNTKVSEKNEELLTTKEDKYSHGRGINSVRRVIEKYNGNISFIDRGEGFEVIATIYGVDIDEQIIKKE
ncbi:MAG: GHKL domain-containing protein [Lachnospiraceae bacterium]|nr:GHKL domain-containing protein [Lachnospiraceae bacterium]